MMGENYKLNKSIRILKCGEIKDFPRYAGDADKYHQTIKVLADGSLIIAEPLLTNLKTVEDMKPAEAENKRVGKQISEKQASKEQLDDLLAAWYINLNVPFQRSCYYEKWTDSFCRNR